MKSTISILPSNNTIQNETQKSKAELIKKLLHDELYNSFAQAVFKIIESPNKILKLFLLTCILVSSSLASYLVVASILTYLDYGVASSTRTLYEAPTQYPEVSFCNLNAFATQYAFEYLKNRNAKVSPNINIFDNNQISNFKYIDKVKLFMKIDAAAHQIMNSQLLTNANLLRLSHDFGDILASCIFNINLI